MGKSSQRKGREAERELSAILQENGFEGVRPGEPLNYGTEPDLVGLPGVHCEVKRHERIEIAPWMAQATADAAKFKDGAPAVFHRRNRQPWAVTMWLEDWIALYRARYKEGTRMEETMQKLEEACAKLAAMGPLVSGNLEHDLLVQKASADVTDLIKQAMDEIAADVAELQAELEGGSDNV